MKKANFSLALLVALVPLFVSVLQQVNLWIAQYKETRDRVNGVTAPVAAATEAQNPEA